MEHTTAFRKESHLPGVLLFSRAMLNFRAAYPPCISSWWMILRKSSQGFDFNLPHGIYQLWHRMINFISIYDVAFMRWCYPRCIFLNNFLIGMFSICTLLCIIRFSWLALISWNVFVPYVNLYLIWSHLVWSYLILDLPILLGYFIFQSTDCTSWTSENMWLSLLITLDIPHPLAFLEKLMQVLQAHEGFEHEHLLNVNLSQWCEHNPLSCDFIDGPIFRSPICWGALELSFSA